jgi:hypothetical protein
MCDSQPGGPFSPPGVAAARHCDLYWMATFPDAEFSGPQLPPITTTVIGSPATNEMFNGPVSGMAASIVCVRVATPFDTVIIGAVWHPRTASVASCMRVNVIGVSGVKTAAVCVDPNPVIETLHN